jgi:membrane protein implicated in regulation of membrane protease activity
MTIFWSLLAAGILVAEMLSFTIYLLAISAAAASAAVASGLGGDLSVQSMTASVVGIFGIVIAHRVRKNMKRAPQMMKDGLVGDGEPAATVIRATGGLRVRWRGSDWDAVMDESSYGLVREGDSFRVVRNEGNRLLLSRIPGETSL